MSEQIRTELRTYMSYLDTQVTPTTIDEIIELGFDTDSVRPIDLRAHPVDLRPRRRWLAAVAAAVVVLVLLGTPLWLPPLTDPDPSPVAGSVVPSTVTPSLPTTVVGSGSERVVGCEIPSAWAQVCDPTSFDGAAMYAVVAGGPGLVAVGANGTDEVASEGVYGPADAIVWTSPDGFTWTRVPDDVDTFGGDGGQQMFDVTVGGPGLVAVGRAGPVAEREGNAAVWTSPDGLAWSRVPHDEAIFGGEGEQRMVSVTVGGPGLVAVGFDSPAAMPNDGEPPWQVEGSAAVWTSPDGLTWTRVPHDEAAFGGESQQMMLSVTTGGPGLVAVGTDGYPYIGNSGQLSEFPDELAVDAAVWTSPDGLVWTRVPHNEAIFGGPDEQRMVSVTAGGPGLVAVGSGTAAEFGSAIVAAVWTSPDGYIWSRVPHDEDIFATSREERWPGAHEEQMLSVTAWGPGLVAVGFDTVAGGCSWDSAVWTSPDGLTWSRVPDERGCATEPALYDRMLSVTVGPFGLVAVGEEYDGSLAAAVWNG
jgi:hypothetical protein